MTRLLPVCLGLLLAAACEKVPLLAPTGSTITLTAATTALSANGTAQVVAQVIEAAGTPPHSGTHITFTTTLGSIEPADATTDINGRAIVTYRAGSNNGNAIITASSGGASTGTNGAVRIAVGTASVAGVSLSANPSTISSNGGVATIIANAIDINGNPLAGVPVRFSTTAGQLGSSVVTSDSSGSAQTTLTTSTQAIVTATVGVASTVTTPPATGTGTPATGTGGGSTSGTASATVTVAVNPLPTVSITGPTGNITANSPVTFTLNVTPGTGSTAQVRDVTVDFGDGSAPRSLGAITGASIPIQYSFAKDGSYTVRVIVTDNFGSVTTGATLVVVLPEPPLSVSITVTSTPSGGNTIYTFTATVSPSTATVGTYVWTIDNTTTVTTTNNQLIRTFVTGEVHTITVVITTTTGRTAQSSVVVP